MFNALIISYLDLLARGQQHILKNQRKIMATLADLQGAAASVSAAVAKVGTDVTAAIADIQALQQSQGGINPSDLDPIVAGLTAAAKSMGDSATALEAILPPPAPAPAPAPAA